MNTSAAHADAWEPPFGWDGDRLTVTDPDQLARLDRPRLSPSSSSAVQSCPARYVAERLTPEHPNPFAPTELGTSAHTVLERFFELPAPQRTRRAARNILTNLAAETRLIDPTPQDRVRRLRWLNDVWRRVQGIFVIEDPTRVLVRRTEWRIDNVEIADGVPFVGLIDRTDITGDEMTAGVSLVDFKAGKVSFPAPWGDSHGDQLRLYTAAVEQVDGRRPVNARVLFTRFGKSRFVSLNRDEMDDTLRRFHQSWVDLRASVEGNQFEAKPSKLCRWCPLVTTCPTAAAEGITEPAETSFSPLIDVPVLTPVLRPVTTRTSSEPGPDTPFDRPETMGNRVPATHKQGDGNNTTTGGAAMTLIEAKPWEPTGPDGTLNPSSYAAIAAFGLVEMAVSELHKAGVLMTPTTVDALAGTFAHIVENAQVGLTGSTSMQDGANTRLRGALRCVIETMPLPFGGTADEWGEWVARATRRTNAIAAAAIRLFENGPSEDPWVALGVEPPAADGDIDDFDDQAA